MRWYFFSTFKKYPLRKCYIWLLKSILHLNSFKSRSIFLTNSSPSFLIYLEGAGDRFEEKAKRNSFSLTFILPCSHKMSREMTGFLFPLYLPFLMCCMTGRRHQCVFCHWRPPQGWQPCSQQLGRKCADVPPLCVSMHKWAVNVTGSLQHH